MSAAMSVTAGGSVVATVLDPNKVSPGLLGFIIVVIIGIAVWFLSKSMAKQLRKLDANRIDDPEQGEADGTLLDEAAPRDAAPRDTGSKDTTPKNIASNGAH